MGKLKNMDNYLEQVLKEGEKSLYHDRYAKIYRKLYKIFNIVLQPILLILAIISFSINENMLGGIFILISIAFLYAYLTYLFTEYCITDKRILKKTGFITRNVQEMNLNSVETVIVKEGIIDRILKTGSIIVSGRGTQKISFNYIDNPTRVRELIKTDL
tara:strand:- start:168 stop:644 length:477 start_codon:yes stop_codon:yes gene_type:complete